MTIAAEPRRRCYRCMRPHGHCICDAVPTVPTRTAVVVLQHPQERLHPFGTARLIRLGMPNARVHTIHGGLEQNLHCPLELPDDAVLLYPHPGAAELSELAAGAPPSTLVVLDGTWSHSRRLYHENPWLQRLRHVRIAPPRPSRYRIRKEPRPECLSTLEATVYALRALEPADTAAGLDGLLTAFETMIDRQIEHVSTAPRKVRHKRPRHREPKALSPLLDDPGYVVLYAESSLPGGDERAPREVVQLAGARLTDGEPFELLIRPSGALPTAGHLRHMGLSAADLRAGLAADAARARLAELAGNGPFGAWTPSSLTWAAPLLPGAAPRNVLKTDYCNLQNRAAGFLEAVVEREGLEPVELDLHGRAAQRLGNALAVARWLKQQRRAGAHRRTP